jgi:hypothetical protein
VRFGSLCVKFRRRNITKICFERCIIAKLKATSEVGNWKIEAKAGYEIIANESSH